MSTRFSADRPSRRKRCSVAECCKSGPSSIEKDRHGLIKRDAVFVRVGLGLSRIPLEHEFSIYVIRPKRGGHQGSACVSLTRTPHEIPHTFTQREEPIIASCLDGLAGAPSPRLRRGRERRQNLDGFAGRFGSSGWIRTSNPPVNRTKRKKR
jgi:hypothetical protein